jgi:tetraacyldisaccharide 4'-kinase
MFKKCMKLFQNLKYKIFLSHQNAMKQKKTFLVKGFLALLWGISIFWQLLAFIRWKLVRRKFLKPYKSSSFVVGIGNIVAGGVGKTPLVIKLVHDLSVFKDQIGVISRGYGVKQKFIPNEINNKTNWKLIGDEPKCILRACQTALFVGKNRKKSAINAEKKGKKLLILDDGFQQKKLSCNLIIIVLNNCDLFGQNYFLPRGYLKDHPSKLAFANLIVINHCHTEKEYLIAKSKVREFSSAPIVGAKYISHEVVDISEKKIDLKNESVGVFCSIANPSTFIKQINNLNCKIVNCKFFGDHEEIKLKALIDFANKCIYKGAKYLICTEKDFVKINHFKTKLPIVILKIAVNICFERTNWDNLIEKIHVSMNNLPVIFKEKFNEKLV